MRLFLLILVGLYQIKNAMIFSIDKADSTIDQIKIGLREDEIILPDFSRDFPQQFRNTEKHTNILQIQGYIAHLGKQNCFILMDNFVNIDVEPFYFPMLLRQYKLGILQTPYQVNKQIWLSSKIGLVNQSMEHVECSVSKYLTGYFMYEKHFKSVKAIIPDNHFNIKSLCVAINSTRFVHQSKPWNCHVHLFLFLGRSDNPLKSFGSVLDYVPAFHYEVYSPDFTYQYPSSRPSISIFVETNESDVEKRVTRIWQRFKFDQDLKLSRTTHEIAIVMYVKSILVSLKAHQLDMNILKVSKICLLCVTCDTEQWNTPISSVLIREELGSIDTLAFRNGAFPSTNEATSWIVSTYDTTNSYSQLSKATKFNDFMISCEVPSILDIISGAKRHYSAQDRLEFAYTSVWKHIFKNYSYTLDPYYISCVNNQRNDDLSFSNPQARLFSFLHPRNMSQQFPVFVETELYNMRFVSCGSRGMSALPFKEFTKIFEIDVWMVYLITLFVLSVLPMLIGIPKFPTIFAFIKSLEIQLRIQLSQDFPGGNNLHVKILITVASFASVVLSNAYKYDNVYRMIAARDVIPYKSYQELIEDNFVIFSRTEVLEIHSELTASNKYFISNHIIHNFTLPGLEMKTELGSTPSVYNSKDFINLYTNSGFHPMMYEFAKKLAVSMNLPQDATQSIVVNPNVTIKIFEPSSPSVIKFKSTYREAETKILYKSIRECNKTAILLPGYLSSQNAIRLQTEFRKKQNSNLANIDVGDEIYEGLHNTFQITGTIAPHIMRRLKGVLNSGIFQWLSELVGLRSINKVEKIQLLKEPSMSGNILVIFVVLWCGWAISFTCFIFEAYKLAFVKISSCILKFVSCVSYFYRIYRKWLDTTASYIYVNVLKIEVKQV